MDLLSIAEKARSEFEEASVDKKLLANLYAEYQEVPDIEKFVERSLGMFPKLSCGLATVYIKHLLDEGEIVRGKYAEDDHTFLRVNGQIVDITADQYDGPKVYVGELKPPWAIK